MGDNDIIISDTGVKAGHGIDHFVLRTITLALLSFYIVAFSGIVTDRFWVIFLGNIGYASLPLLAFLSVEAYRHSGKLTSLIVRNIIFSLLCAVPYRFAFYSEKSFSDIRSYFSLALTCFFCIGSVMFYDRMKTKNQRIFCVVFLCAISLLIHMDFALYMPIITFVIYIYLREQEGKDRAAAEKGDKERLAAVERRKYLLSNYTFIKVSYYIVTLSVVVFFVSLMFAKFASGYKESFAGEITRNYCMPGMLLSLPFIRIYNGTKGIDNKLTRAVFRVYYLLFLVLVVMIKIFFLYDYS